MASRLEDCVPVKSGHAPKVDGGFCRGGDIVKAIAIGADRHQRPAMLGARGQASRAAFLILTVARGGDPRAIEVQNL